MAFVMPPLGTLIVPTVLIGPPVSPAPVAIFDTEPVPTEAQVHAELIHCRTWPFAQVLRRERLSVPLEPPPTRPLPLAVVTPAIAFNTPAVISSLPFANKSPLVSKVKMFETLGDRGFHQSRNTVSDACGAGRLPRARWDRIAGRKSRVYRRQKWRG